MIDSLSLRGFRGFTDMTVIEFAKPTGKPGSGLTTLVGGNNTGKTTVIEAMQLFNSSNSDIYLSEGKRNAAVNGETELILQEEVSGSKYLWAISNREHGGASVSLSLNSEPIDLQQLRRSADYIEDFPAIYVLQSHRFMEPEFYQNTMDRRTDYLRNTADSNVARRPTLSQFEVRLFQMEKHRDAVSHYIDRAFGGHVQWQVERRDNGAFYLKFTFGNTSHSLDGAGDGLWNVFTLCDSLYDAPEGSMILLDEPEQSLHPQLQKRIMSILLEESRTKQIVISTHSPYFLDWTALSNQGALYRFSKDSSGRCRVHRLGEASIQWIGKILNDIQKPHTLGLNAKEVFFLNDGVVVCEGQDDVVMLQRIAGQLNIRIDGEIFGWGAGGSSNINMVLGMLEDLGFKRVVAIFDGNVLDQASDCSKQHPNYSVLTIPTEDIRDKDPVKEKGPVSGMVNKKGILKDDYTSSARKLILDINSYLK